MLSRSLHLLIGSFFVPISTTFATGRAKHLSNGLDLIHRVLSRPLDIGISHIDGCIGLKKVDMENHEGFKDYISSLVTVFNAHHHGEDEILFPTFEKKIKNADFSMLKKQHKELHPLVVQIATKIDVDNPSLYQYEEIRNLLKEIKDLWNEHRDNEEQIVELEMEPVMSLAEQIELNNKLSKHGQSMSEPANLVLPFLIYNLEGAERDEFIDDMPWILKKFIVPIVWKSKWEKMRPFLLT
jgi:hemerythrin-like domain-containing protein